MTTGEQTLSPMQEIDQADADLETGGLTDLSEQDIRKGANIRIGRRTIPVLGLRYAHDVKLYNGEDGSVIEIYGGESLVRALAMEEDGGKNRVLDSGDLLWDLEPPQHLVVQEGHIACPLNAKHPDFDKWRIRGYQPCQRSKLRSTSSLENHIRVQHDRMHRDMQREIQDVKEKAAEIRDQALLRALNLNPAPVALPPAEAEAEAEKEALDMLREMGRVCGVCSRPFKTKGAATTHMKKAHKPEEE